MWEQQLLSMYQQWCQGNEDYVMRYMDFVALVARHRKLSTETALEELQKYRWFGIPKPLDY
jgi:hypothetical protein